jgi:hypothetical protein
MPDQIETAVLTSALLSSERGGGGVWPCLDLVCLNQPSWLWVSVTYLFRIQDHSYLIWPCITCVVEAALLNHDSHLGLPHSGPWITVEMAGSYLSSSAYGRLCPPITGFSRSTAINKIISNDAVLFYTIFILITRNLPPPSLFLLTYC